MKSGGEDEGEQVEGYGGGYRDEDLRGYGGNWRFG